MRSCRAVIVSRTCTTSHSLSFVEHRALIEAVVPPVEATLLPRRAEARQGSYRLWSCHAGRNQVRALLDRSVAIHAVDLHRVARLAVELAIAVAVLLEVTVDAVHALFQMDIFQVHCLPKLVGIVEGDRLVVGVEQVALAIVLEDSAKDPSVTVEVGKLRVLQLLVEFRRAGSFQKCRYRTKPANSRSLPDCAPELAFCSPASGLRCCAGHMCSPSISLSHHV